MGIISKTIGNPIDQENLLTYNTEELYDNNTPLFGQKMGTLYGVPSSAPKIQDFRQIIRERTNKNPNLVNKAKTVLSNSLPYDTQNIESRVNLGDPGNPNGKNLTSYVNGGYRGAASEDSFDKINASGLKSNRGFTEEYQDLVKFGIGIYGGGQFLNFRAFLNQISDSYTSDWTDTKYVGRAEKFYTYSGFDRKISLSWTVAAQSKIELIPMYQKLNYLASMCAPSYTSKNYMTGNILQLTVGGYIVNQPGIITGISFEMNDDNATWEIAIGEEDKEINGIRSEDPSIKELPHLIKVTGFNFIPIHNFVPSLSQRFIVP